MTVWSAARASGRCAARAQSRQRPDPQPITWGSVSDNLLFLLDRGFSQDEVKISPKMGLDHAV